MSRRAILALAAAIVLSASARAESPGPVREGPQALDPREHRVGRRIADAGATDLEGRARTLAEFDGSRALVVALTRTTCPVSKRYAPALARLEQEYAPRGARFVFLAAGTADAPDALRAFAAAAGFQGPVLLDRAGDFCRALGAVSTTDVFVLDAARTLVFRGAVDDQYGLAYSLDAPRRRLLVDALEAVLAGLSPLVAATTAPGCLLSLPAGEPPADGPLTYHGRISRILQNHCVECHRDGAVAPFPLDTLKDVRANADMVRLMVERRAMPPWFAAPPADGHPSPWANDRSLSADDRKALLDWIAARMPAGNEAESPVARRYPAAWTIGTPDAVFELPQEVEVKAEGVMPYVHLYVETSFPEDRWVQAMEVQPTAPEVVHHVLVHIVPKRNPGEDRRVWERRHRVGEQDGFFAAYVPGSNHMDYPEGLAKRLPAGAVLRFQMHYTPIGAATRDRTRVGFRFAEVPPRQVVRTAGIAGVRIDIPPGAPDHPEKARIPVPWNVTLLSFMPHMHVRGKAFRYDLTTPDGTRTTLLDVPRYDFNWQIPYVLREPLAIPRGSRIEVTGWFDNSADNPANPDPKKRVRWGPQTYDEMLLGYVDYVLTDGEPVATATAENGGDGAPMPPFEGDLEPADSPEPGSTAGTTPAPADSARRERRLRALLRAFDPDGDGRVPRADVPERLHPAFDRLDADGDGVVTEEELKGGVR